MKYSSNLSIKNILSLFVFGFFANIFFYFVELALDVIVSADLGVRLFGEFGDIIFHLADDTVLAIGINLRNDGEEHTGNAYAEGNYLV